MKTVALVFLMFSLCCCDGSIFHKMGGGCKMSKVHCWDDSSFTVCADLGDFAIVVKLCLKCPEGYYCNDETRFPCIPRSPTPDSTTETPLTTIESDSTTITPRAAVTTTTPITITTPITTTPVVITTTPITSTTPVITTTLITTTTPIITNTPTKTTEATTTTKPVTTTATPTTTIITTTTVRYTGEPSCSYHEFYPGPTCNQYYECVQVWWWFESRLKNCDTGYAYSTVTKSCVLQAVSGCTN